MNGKQMLDTGVVVTDVAGQQAIDKAAQAGVPWALIVKAVQQAIVVVAGAAGGAKSKCVAQALVSPGRAAAVTTAATVDLGRAMNPLHSGDPDDAPGKSTWWAIRPVLKFCGIKTTGRRPAEAEIYKFFRALSASSSAEKAVTKKLDELYKAMAKAAKKDLNDKIAIIQAEARIKKAKVAAKAVDRRLFTDQTISSGGSGGGGGMLLAAAAAAFLLTRN